MTCFAARYPGAALSSEDVGARLAGRLSLIDQAEIVVNDMQNAQELSLVLVDPLDLDVEERVDIDDDPGCLPDHAGQALLAAPLDGCEPLLEPGIPRHGLQLAEPLEVTDPGIANRLRDQLRQAGIRDEKPATLRHAVRLVVEFLGATAR